MHSFGLWLMLALMVVAAASDEGILERLLRALARKENEDINHSKKGLNDPGCGVNRFNNAEVKRKSSTKLKEFLKRIFKNEEKVENLVARIHGGTEAKVGQFPCMVLVMNEAHNLQCGGSLISDQWVLTAAHCIGMTADAISATKPENMKLYLGEHSQVMTESAEIKVMAEKIFVHPKYDRGISNQHDVALLKMASSVDYNEYIRPICFPTSEVVVETECYASGWGLYQQKVSQVLRTVKLQIISDEKCQKHGGTQVLPGMICAAQPNGEGITSADVCQGDSGGPLSCLEGGVFVLGGATSFGDYCHENKPTPGYYSDPVYYKSWVESIMSGKEVDGGSNTIDGGSNSGGSGGSNVYGYGGSTDGGGSGDYYYNY